DARDAEARDAGPRDTDARDAEARDAGPRDTGARDAGPRDTGARDAGPSAFPAGAPGDADPADDEALDDLFAGEDDALDEDGDDVFSAAVRLPASPIAPERRAHAWAMLNQLDEQFRLGTELSNSLLLAAVCSPFLFDDLVGASTRPVEINDAVLAILHPLVQQLQVARRDAERCRQILLAQRRLAPARRRRGKPMSLVRRDFFGDALLVYQMSATVGGHDTSDLGYWTRLHGQDAGGERGAEELRGGKRRRRRRGGRRRRRTPLGEEQGGEREPAVS